MRLYTEEELYQSIRELQIIPVKRLEDAYQESKRNKIKLTDILLTQDLLAEDNLAKIVAELVSLPFVDLSETAIDEDTLKIIPEVYAVKQKVIAFKRDKNGLHIAMVDPSNKEIPDFIAKKSGIPVKVYLATKRGMQDALALYNKDVGKVFDKIITENVKQVKGSTQPEPPIIKIVETIIEYAYQNRASDIHIEPFDNESVVRFRIDGLLHDIVRLPSAIQPQVVTRIKVMAKLRTDEHQSAQDGKISIKNENEELDIRVSIVPVTNGEKIVMRLLSERSRQFSLADLGFSESDMAKINEAYKKPHGMVLATGPTGSGKTTTLYALLKLLNRRDVNIMTIEDPVEYEIEGINQIQVNSNTNLTFADGLRSIVRQDPDIILVGEIRDTETAGISINAAMTGHLVLSTLHTNDAATTIPRLLDLGVEPYLAASSISVIIAQRLVRKICQKCRSSYEINLDKKINNDDYPALTLNLLKKYFIDKTEIRLYKGKGCEVCHQTGYLGREGIYEVIVVDDEIRDAIVAKKDASEITKIAHKNGMTTMVENAIEKVKAGITTLEEIVRVTTE
jgi:type IV pilus assembly protein PilB